MFSRFILITDLSPESLVVGNCLEGLKKYSAKQCLLLLCLSFQEAMSVTLSRTTDLLEDTLHQLKETIATNGFKVEARIVPGFAVQEINSVAIEGDYSLIVLGFRNYSIVKEIFLKGATTNMIYNYCKPLLLIRLDLNKEYDLKEMRDAHRYVTGHILYLTDFSKNAESAFLFVQKLATGSARRVTLLHVQANSGTASRLNCGFTEYNKLAWDRLEAMKKLLQEKARAVIEIEICCGSPSAEIIRVIRERCVDLVVMGSRNRGFIKGLFSGSLTEYVVRHSETSVLLIPAGLR